MNVTICSQIAEPEYERFIVDSGHSYDYKLSVITDIALFTGGEDVSPDLYNAWQVDPRTFSSRRRDNSDIGAYRRAVDVLRKPVVGICRGGQFVNVMRGGTMIQHDPRGTRGSHKMKRGLALKQHIGHLPFEVEVSSTHHQVMVPGSDGLVLYVDSEARTPEVIMYSREALCFQPHPEFQNSQDQTDLFWYLVNGMVA